MTRRLLGGLLDEERLRRITARSQDIYCLNNPGDLPKGCADLVQCDVPDLVSEVRHLQDALTKLINATFPNSTPMNGNEMRHVSQLAVHRAMAALPSTYVLSEETQAELTAFDERNRGRK